MKGKKLKSDLNNLAVFIRCNFNKSDFKKPTGLNTKALLLKFTSMKVGITKFKKYSAFLYT